MLELLAVLVVLMAIPQVVGFLVALPRLLVLTVYLMFGWVFYATGLSRLDPYRMV